MPATNNIEIVGDQLLYERPEALHSAVHSDLRFQPTDAPFAAAAKAHLAPLLIGEFPQAMINYPIIFAGPDRRPLAVMGLAEGTNLFMKEDRFEDGVYVPAYVRRYPFTLAGAGEEQFVVCIDRNAPGFGSDGSALFEDGQPTEFTRNAMAFLNEFEAERKSTAAFVEMLEAADLFEIKNTLFIEAGTDRKEHIADYFAVSEDKLRALPAKKLAELVMTGAMAAIDAHLFSLQRWDSLIARRATIVAAAAAAKRYAPVEDLPKSKERVAA